MAFFSAESGMAIFRFLLGTEKAIDPNHPAYPVQNKYYDSARRSLIRKPYFTSTFRSLSVKGTRLPSLLLRILFSCRRKSFSNARSFLNSCRICIKRAIAELVIEVFMSKGNTQRGYKRKRKKLRMEVRSVYDRLPKIHWYSLLVVIIKEVCIQPRRSRFIRKHAEATLIVM